MPFLPLNVAVLTPNHAQMPLAVLMLDSNPLNNTMDRGYHCLGCAKAICSRPLLRKALDCRGCQTSSQQGGIDQPRSKNYHDADATWSCKAAVDRGKLYSRAEILAHIAVCNNVQNHLADLEIEKGRPPGKKKKLKRRRYG